MMRTKVLSKAVAIALGLMIAIGVGMPVSAHELASTERADVVYGICDDGTPVILHLKTSSTEANINIIDSKVYGFTASFPWGTIPPESMTVSIPIGGSIYKGTLKRSIYLNNDLTHRVDAVYRGTIIGVI